MLVPIQMGTNMAAGNQHRTFHEVSYLYVTCMYSYVTRMFLYVTCMYSFGVLVTILYPIPQT